MGKIKISPAGNKILLPLDEKRILRFPRGFTLLELILVIFIAGLAASIVTVYVGRAYENTVFKEASKRVFIVLKHARETAVMEKASVAFKIDEKNNSYWTEKDNNVYGSAHSMPRGVAIKGENVTFSPKGSSSGGRIMIIDEKNRGYYIDVDPVLGTPKIKRI